MKIKNAVRMASLLGMAATILGLAYPVSSQNSAIQVKQGQGTTSLLRNYNAPAGAVNFYITLPQAGQGYIFLIDRSTGNGSQNYAITFGLFTAASQSSPIGQGTGIVDCIRMPGGPGTSFGTATSLALSANNIASWYCPFVASDLLIVSVNFPGGANGTDFYGMVAPPNMANVGAYAGTSPGTLTPLLVGGTDTLGRGETLSLVQPNTSSAGSLWGILVGGIDAGGAFRALPITANGSGLVAGQSIQVVPTQNVTGPMPTNGVASPYWVSPISGGATLINTVTTTAVKAAGGSIAKIVIGTGAVGTIDVFNIASASCTGTPASPLLHITTATADSGKVIPLDLAMNNGICVQTVTAVGSITVIYE